MNATEIPRKKGNADGWCESEVPQAPKPITRTPPRLAQAFRHLPIPWQGASRKRCIWKTPAKLLFQRAAFRPLPVPILRGITLLPNKVGSSRHISLRAQEIPPDTPDTKEARPHPRLLGRPWAEARLIPALILAIRNTQPTLGINPATILPELPASRWINKPCRRRNILHKHNRQGDALP